MGPNNPFSEFEWIEELKREARSFHSFPLGIGDDCAVLDGFSRNKNLLVTTDLLTEGIHFRLEWGTPEMLGQKSVAVNLSDIAAMGGKPLALFCAVAVPREKKFILRPLAQGIRKACEAYRVDFLGGDTNQAQEHLTICHTVLGEVPAGKYLRRQGAKKDDLIFCTGTIGDHGLGLEILKHPQEFPQLSPAERERLVHGFLSPTPRVEMGQHLQKIDGITSVIDISDGLLQDLGHILSASQVSAVLDPNRIPLSAPFRKSGLDVRTACTVGEDYELLFTARPAKQREVTALSSSSLAISCLGQIIACEGSVPGILDPDKKPWKVDTGGYRHF